MLNSNNHRLVYCDNDNIIRFDNHHEVTCRIGDCSDCEYYPCGYSPSAPAKNDMKEEQIVAQVEHKGVSYDIVESKRQREVTGKGDKFDYGKPRFDLIPYPSIYGMAQCLTYGSIKYGDRNWARGIKYSRLFAATQRHLWAWFNGETLDKESGLNHLDHALTDLAMLRGMRGDEWDDRPKDSNPA